MVLRAYVWLCALINAGIGLWCLIDPVGALAPVGVGALDPAGVVELRAMYGGLELGVAAFLVWAARSPGLLRAGAMAATLEIGGLGLVRTISWLIVAPAGWMLPFLCAAELGGSGLGALLLWRTRDGS